MLVDMEIKVNTAEAVPPDAWQACAGLKVKRSDCISSAEEPLYQTLGMLLKGLSAKPAVAPAEEFKAKNPQQQQSVSCAFQTENGHLFFLKKSMLFVQKPLKWLKYSEIVKVELRKNPLRKNSFDMVVKGVGPEMEFKQIDMGVFEAVFAFMEQNSELGGKLVNKDVASNSGVSEQHPTARRARTANAKSKADEVEDNEYDEEQDDDFEDGDDDSDDEDDDDDDDEESGEPAKKKVRNRK